MGLTKIKAKQISNLDFKQAARVVTVTNVTLAGGAPAVVDGVSLLTNNRVLVTGQTNKAQNGIYRVSILGTGSNGTWIRTTDADATGEVLSGMVIMVTEGAVYADRPWKLVTNGAIIIGVTELDFQLFNGGTPGGANTNIQFNESGTFAGSANLIWLGDELRVVGLANVAGNVTANYFLGDGSLLTGITGGGGNVTVSADPPIIANSGDIWIDSDTAIQYLYFDDGNSSQWAEMQALVSISSGASGNVDLSAVAQDIIPSANATYSLGNTTNRWANLFLVGNTIDLGGAQIKSDASSGAIALIPAPTANVANPSALVISTSGGINVVETTGGEISGGAIANAAATASPPGAPRITQIIVTDGSYDPTGATAVAPAGGFVQIVGNGFQSGCQALIGSTSATATGFQSSEILDVQVPAQSAGSYIVYVVNPDGGVGLRPNGITYSGLPTWVTASILPSQTLNQSVSIQLEATSDSAVSYALAAGNSLPGNLSLSSAGLISGNVTSQAVSPTTYNFTVVATDAESQTSPRSFDLVVADTVSVEYLVVAGGGGTSQISGGGGAGGYRTSAGTSGGGASAESALLIAPATNYTVTVGGGGAATSGTPNSGSNSVFGSITSVGGGGAGAYNGSEYVAAVTGGSGGGASLTGTGASGTTNQGFAGGNYNASAGAGGSMGGGGGAAGVGGNATTTSGGTGGVGGTGVSSSITGTAVTRAGGGGGGGVAVGGTGQGGGGNGGTNSGGIATNGSVNTGGGAGGSRNFEAGKNGGSGVVILKYPNTFTLTNPGGGLTFTTSTAVAGFKITTFTAGTGNIQFN